MKTSKQILIGLMALVSMVLCALSLLHVPFYVPWLREVSRWVSALVFLCFGIWIIYRRPWATVLGSGPTAQGIVVLWGFGFVVGAYLRATGSYDRLDDVLMAVMYLAIALHAFQVLSLLPVGRPKASDGSTET